MKKFLLASFCFLWLSVMLTAGPVSPNQARSAALGFMSRTMPTVTRNSVCELAYSHIDSRSADVVFYVFNVGGGFVIIAGDDAVTPVLGYSLNGSFSADRMPENCRLWLQGYADEIVHVLMREDYDASPSLSAEWQCLLHDTPAFTMRSVTAVQPLLTTTWTRGNTTTASVLPTTGTIAGMCGQAAWPRPWRSLSATTSGRRKGSARTPTPITFMEL